MKFANIKLLALALVAMLFTACDWKDLPSYEDAEITQTQFEYRWEGSRKDAVTGEPIVEYQMLNCSYDIDSANAYVSVTVTVPAANNNGVFTDAVRNKVSLDNLVGYVTLSAAARATVIDGKPLGTPDNWTVEKKIKVEAANGTSKVWTIKVVEFNK